MTRLQYFNEPSAPDASVRRQLVAPFRSMRTADLDVSLEFANEIGITVELSKNFSVTRRTGRKASTEVGAFGNVTIDLPSQPLDLSIRGDCRIVQLALPLSLLVAFAAKDHELDASGFDLQASNGKSDMRLLRLVCRGAAIDEARDEVLHAVVAHLLTSYSSLKPPVPSRFGAGLAPSRLRRVHDFVAADLGSATLGGMAEAASLSPFHFAREFQRTCGEAPWSYVVSRRVAQAVELLTSHDLPLELVARSAGFSHASHMSRHLKARLGMSATKIRECLLP